MKLKKIIAEKFKSKAQMKYLYATDPDLAKEFSSTMTKKDYDALPDKLDEDANIMVGHNIFQKLKNKDNRDIFVGDIGIVGKNDTVITWSELKKLLLNH